MPEVEDSEEITRGLFVGPRKGVEGVSWVKGVSIRPGGRVARVVLDVHRDLVDELRRVPGERQPDRLAEYIYPRRTIADLDPDMRGGWRAVDVEAHGATETPAATGRLSPPPLAVQEKVNVPSQ
jgi:hypothetical protein